MTEKQKKKEQDVENGRINIGSPYDLYIKAHLESYVNSVIRRIENDENSWIKIQESANRQHSDSLNQLADLFRLVDTLVKRIEKLEERK